MTTHAKVSAMLIDLLEEPDDEAWKLRASCRTSAFPDFWYSNNHTDRTIAQQTCASCPVADHCLLYAHSHDDLWGTWGGVLQKDRRAAYRAARQGA